MGYTSTPAPKQVYCPKCGAAGDATGPEEELTSYECRNESCGHAWRVIEQTQPAEIPTQA